MWNKRKGDGSTSDIQGLQEVYAKKVFFCMLVKHMKLKYSSTHSQPQCQTQVSSQINALRKSLVCSEQKTG
jgi:hypothetical protein